MPRRNKNAYGSGKKVNTERFRNPKKRVPNDPTIVWQDNPITQIRPTKNNNYPMTRKNPSEHGYTS